MPITMTQLSTRANGTVNRNTSGKFRALKDKITGFERTVDALAQHNLTLHNTPEGEEILFQLHACRHQLAQLKAAMAVVRNVPPAPRDFDPGVADRM